MRTLFFEPGPSIDVDRLERIFQAVIFYADKVAVRGSAPVEARNGNVIHHALRTLEELSLLEWWAHEYELGPGDRVSVRNDPNVRTASLVIPASEFAAVVDATDEVVRTSRAAAYDFVPPTAGDLRQGIAEVVDFRQKLVTLGLHDIAGTDGMLTTPSWIHKFDQDSRALADQSTTETAVSQLVSDLDIGRLSALRPGEIVQLREHTARFAQLLADRVASTESRSAGGPVASALRAEYEGIVAEVRRQQVARRIGWETSWSVAGLVFAPSFLLRHGVDLFSWRRRRRPFALISELKRIPLPKDGH